MQARWHALTLIVCGLGWTRASRLSRGVALFGEGREKEALVAVERAVAASPLHFSGVDLLGRVLLSAGGPRLPEAAHWLGVSVAISPTSPRARGKYGQVLGRLGRLREALRELSWSIALGTSGPAGGIAAAHANRGVALERLGADAEAIISYEAALAIDPGGAKMHTNRARAIARLGGDPREVLWVDSPA